MKKGHPSLLKVLLVVTLSLFVVMFFLKLMISTSELRISYSDFLDGIESLKVVNVVIYPTQRKLVGYFMNGVKFSVEMIEDDQLIPLLRKYNVYFTIKNPSPMSGIISNIGMFILPVIIMIIFWLVLFRQAGNIGNQALLFGKSKAKMVGDNFPKVTFNDVAGVDEAKEELKEIVEFLKDRRKFIELGAKIPKGILLLGPPGCGKTLLARAVAGEAGVPFFYMSGSDFVELFVGVGAARVRDLFTTAKRNSPCIIFIDELDAVGRQRGAGLGGGHDEREQTLNQILVEMDGFDPNTGVILISATNRPDVLDPALLRPGRFDRQVVVDKPDLEGRKAILKVHTRGKKIANDVDLDTLAKRTPGFTGADIENLVNEAAIIAARKKQKEIKMIDLEEAVEKVIAGPERKSRVISEREKMIIAYHEAGHALVAKLIPNSDPVHKISILPRGLALGYTLQLPNEDRYISTKSELLDKLTILLGGRAAEKIAIGEITTGAHNDLERATEIARDMITRFGMSDRLGPLTFGKKHESIFLGRDISEDRNYSDEVAATIDKEAHDIIDFCYKRAEKLLLAEKERLEIITSYLIERESLESYELDIILRGDKLTSPPKKAVSEQDVITQKVPKISEVIEIKDIFKLIDFKTILYQLLNTLFYDSITQSKINDIFKSSEDALKRKDFKSAISLLNIAEAKGEDNLLSAALHLKLSLIFLEMGKLDMVLNELFNFLEKLPEELSKKDEKIIISALKYFDIIQTVISLEKKSLEEIEINPQIVKKLNEIFINWRKNIEAEDESEEEVNSESDLNKENSES